MNLRKNLKFVARWWRLVLSIFGIVTVTGFLFSFLQPPQYRTSMTLMVSPKASITDLSALSQRLDTLDNPTIINTYAEIIRSRSIFDQALGSLMITDPAPLVDVYVEVIQQTNLIKVEVEGNDPQLIYALINAIAGKATQYIDSLYEVLEIKVLDTPVLPTYPFKPEVLRNTLIASALGLIFGLAASFFAEYKYHPLDILETFSIIDQESGLYTRRYFLQRLREEVNRARRHNRSLSVCMIHLKNLDQAENLYPHQTRMTVRRRALAYMKRHIRQDEILASWEPSTLVWLLFEATESTTRLAIERISFVLEGKVFEDDETGTVFSFAGVFGAAIFDNALTDSDLISLSEQALRQARQYGLGSVKIITGKETEMLASAVNPPEESLN